MVDAIQNKKEIIMNPYLKKIVWIIFLLPVAYLAITWNTIPDTVPLHYDMKGDVDKYGSKKELLLLAGILTLVNILVYFLLSNIYRIDPKKYAAENKDRLHRLAFAVSIFISGILCVIIYSTTHPAKGFNMRLVFAGVGLLFCIIGNYMSNLKPNYFAGFRLPWTLESESNWRKTHHLGGKLWFVGGLVIAIVSLFVSEKKLYAVFISLTMVITLIPVIYSFIIYREEKRIKSKTK